MKPWIGGYDLINETNWPFPEGNNSQMKSLFQRITDSIRVVDQNHFIYIEGNGFANDFSGLTPPWDPNMAYSFHKYWTYNNANSPGLGDRGCGISIMCPCGWVNRGKLQYLVYKPDFSE